MLKILAAVSGVVGLGLLGIGTYRYQAESATATPAGPNFVIDGPDRDLGELAVGDEVAVDYRITNTGNRPVGLIGTEGGGCGQNCCFHEKHIESLPGRVAVPPGESVTFPCVLRVRRPGPITWEMTLFVEDNGIHNVRLSVRGTSVAVPNDATP